MHSKLVSFAFTAATTILLHPGAFAARPCSGAGAGDFWYRLGDVRYDGPDLSKENVLATIAASLQSSSQTPLYDCVSQWPESWAGWFEKRGCLIWADCIFTGAAPGPDETVSFAVDWKKRVMFLAHTFACSDKAGFKGLATGSIKLDFNCTTADGSSYCTLRRTSTGGRPTLNITTQLVPAAVNETLTCADKSKQYQSWVLENWLRRIEIEPGSSPADPNVVSDSGPSFTLKSLADGHLFSCKTSGQQSGTFAGTCQLEPESTPTLAADFRFDSTLNMLRISQRTECDASSFLDVIGVFYMQATCDRGSNSNEFTCTSAPVWVGTGVV